MSEKLSVSRVEDEVVLRWVAHYREAEEDEEGGAGRDVGSLMNCFSLPSGQRLNI